MKNRKLADLLREAFDRGTIDVVEPGDPIAAEIIARTYNEKRDTMQTYTYRGYRMTTATDGRIMVDRDKQYIGDYPSVGAATKAIDYREGQPYI